MTTTLLAVDDSLTMRKVLEITFAGESFKTVIATNGEEAMSLAKSERPAVALVDHTLPDMAGYDLCRELKAVSPGMAVLILSSKQNPYDKARGAAMGVDDFMDKPFDTQKLLDKVSQVLAQPRAVAAAAPAARAAAPVAAAPAAIPTASARPRSQTLSYGTPAPAPAPPPPAPAPGPTARTLPGTPAVASPQAAAAAPRMAAPAAKPAAAVAAAVAAGNGQLTDKLQALGLSATQVEGVLALSREVVEKVVWEVVPVLAETIIKEELRRLTAE